jgi:hypothetical protein
MSLKFTAAMLLSSAQKSGLTCDHSQPIKTGDFEVYHTASTGESADSSAVHYFTEDYQARFNEEPDRFARIGYDTGSFIFQSLETAGNPAYLRRAVQTGMPHDGMAYRIHFDGKPHQSISLCFTAVRSGQKTAH